MSILDEAKSKLKTALNLAVVKAESNYTPHADAIQYLKAAADIGNAIANLECADKGVVSQIIKLKREQEMTASPAASHVPVKGGA